MTTRVHDYCAAIWALSLPTDCLRIAAQSSDWDSITGFTAAVVMLRLRSVREEAARALRKYAISLRADSIPVRGTGISIRLSNVGAHRTRM